MRATDKFPLGICKQRRKLLDYTIGVTFLGTPFRGSWKTGTAAAEARVGAALERNDEHTWEFAQYLKMSTAERPSPLDEMVQRFSEMCSHDEFKFEIVCVYETRGTSLETIKKRAPSALLNEKGSDIVRSYNLLSWVLRAPLC